MRPGEKIAWAVLAAAAFFACGGRRPLAAAGSAPPAPAVPSPADAAPPKTAALETVPPSPVPADLFQSEVKPLLMRRCAPCHAPGGRLYDRLPFDDPAIVRPRYEKMKSRLKPDEQAVLERWLAREPAAAAPR